MTKGIRTKSEGMLNRTVGKSIPILYIDCMSIKFRIICS